MTTSRCAWLRTSPPWRPSCRLTWTGTHAPSLLMTRHFFFINLALASPPPRPPAYTHAHTHMRSKIRGHCWLDPSESVIREQYEVLKGALAWDVDAVSKRTVKVRYSSVGNSNGCRSSFPDGCLACLCPFLSCPVLSCPVLSLFAFGLCSFTPLYVSLVARHPPPTLPSALQGA